MVKAYLRFCLFFKRSPVPADNHTVLAYATFLARSLSPNSIPAYLNIIKLMHMEKGYPSPLRNWELNAVTRGIQRRLGSPPKQKLPITIDLLTKIHAQLDLHLSEHKAFWAACVIAFFAFLRKSTLLPKSASSKEKALCIKDVSLNESMLFLHIRHTKTIQFGQRRLDIPINAIPGSILCPVSAMAQVLSGMQPGSVSVNQPLFNYTASDGKTRFLNHSVFMSLLKTVLCKCNVNINDYSGHSFRRGGCSYAFSLGISPLLIKLRGDWRSEAYQRYVNIKPEQHMNLAQTLALYVTQTLSG